MFSVVSRINQLIFLKQNLRYQRVFHAMFMPTEVGRLVVKAICLRNI